METPLSQVEFYILLSLAIKSRHGYEIMQQVEADSGRKVILGPGTLYGAIKRMKQSELIEEVAGDDSRRKYYRLTEKGKTSLSAELKRYDDVLKLAKQTRVFSGLGLSELVIGL